AKYLASTMDDGVRLWDLQHPSAPRILDEGPGHRSPAHQVAFSTDSARLAATNGDVIRVWELGNLSATPLTLAAHQGGNGGPIAFSPDGMRLAIGGNDKTVRIRELQSPGSPLVLLARTARGGGHYVA